MNKKLILIICVSIFIILGIIAILLTSQANKLQKDSDERKKKLNLATAAGVFSGIFACASFFIGWDMKRNQSANVSFDFSGIPLPP